jgi:hypothetical protein
MAHGTASDADVTSGRHASGTAAAGSVGTIEEGGYYSIAAARLPMLRHWGPEHACLP